MGRLVPEVRKESYPGVRISSQGKYHCFALTKMFAYVDGMMTDIRNDDDELVRKICDAHSLEKRLIVVREFSKKLGDEWGNNPQEKPSAFDWPAWQSALVSDVARVEKNSTR